MSSPSPSGAAAPGPVPGRAPALGKFYFAAWRWHFYAGLYVLPFLVMLATTGLVMLWISVLAGRDGERLAVVPGPAPLALEAQAGAAAAAVPGGSLGGYIAPAARPTAPPSSASPPARKRHPKRPSSRWTPSPARCSGRGPTAPAGTTPSPASTARSCSEPRATG